MELLSAMPGPHSLSFPFPVRQKMALMELTYLAQQWQPIEDPPLYGSFMASSEVDQKFLGHFAKTTSSENSYLSSFLFRVLGLSVVLSDQLLRARKARRLDPVRDPKARHLIHHILWLAREGLVMVEQYILPMIENYIELKVLSYKLRASFYHIFVLFHNDPPVNNRVARSRSASTSSAGVAGTYNLFPTPLAPKSNKSHSRSSREPIRSPAGRQPSPGVGQGNTIPAQMAAIPTTTPPVPPGLGGPTSFSINPQNKFDTYNQNFNYTYYSSSSNNNMPHFVGGKSPPDPSLATYLLPLTDYTPHATSAFIAASTFADNLLPGSHPVRLSVKVEYVAYVYDCLREAEVSRKLARASIRHVYEATEGMDDESFEDAAHLVGILGKMMRRGLAGATSAAGGRIPIQTTELTSAASGGAAVRGGSVGGNGSSASRPQSTSRKGSGVSIASGRSGDNIDATGRHSGSRYSNSNGNGNGSGHGQSQRHGNSNSASNSNSNGSTKIPRAQAPNPIRRGNIPQSTTQQPPAWV